MDRKEYLREYNRKWLAARRTAWFEKNGPCAQCGSWQNLELDHINPENKVSHRLWSWSKERREAELSKCQALCHDCHQEKSRQELLAPCGIAGKYRRGCRCEACTKANRLKMRAYRAKKKAEQ